MDSKYSSIQIGRAFAALIVVLLHSIDLTNDISSDGVGFPAWLSSGYAGVDIFFVISGFIISLVVDRRESSTDAFISRRIIRIIPIYWFFTLLWFGISTVAGHTDTQRGLLSSLLLLPTGVAPILGVGWSLEQEFLFYALVAILLAAGKFRLLPFALAFLFVAGVAWNVLLQRGWDYRILSLYQFQFLLGVLIYRFRNWVATQSGPLLLGLGVFAFVGSSVLVNDLYGSGHVPTVPIGIPGLVRVIGFGLSGVLLLGGLLALEASNASLFERPFAKALISIGDASYSLYLVHRIVFAVLGKVAGALGIPGSLAAPAMAAGVTIAVLLSLSFYRFVERPFLSWAHHRV